MAEAPAPDISVVIPCYNAEKWVGRAIDSVLAQEGVSVEVIVVDDGSTDGSVEVLRGYDDRIHWETGPNRGACAARNRGLEIARAEYVMFLDADDYVEGPILSAALRSLSEAHSEIAFGSIAIEHGSAREYYALPPKPTAEFLMFYLLDNRFLPPCGTIWRRRILEAIGGWNEDLRRFQDYELTFRALSVNPKISVFDEGHGIYHQHASPDRISLRTDKSTAEDQADVLRMISFYLQNIGVREDRVRDTMRARAYGFWRTCARSNDIASSKVAQNLYEEFGGRKHLGSLSHKIICNLIGLRRKEVLSKFLNGVFSNARLQLW